MNKVTLILFVIISSVLLLGSQSNGREESGSGMSSQVITGTVDSSGRVVTADGRTITLIGSKAEEVRRYVGEKVQVKGVMITRDDQANIEVLNYKLMKEPLMNKE